MDMLRPTAIRSGATVGVFTPSEPLTENRLDLVMRGASLLQSHGFKVKFAAHFKSHTGYTAGTIQERINDIHALLSDPEVDLLMAAWGGRSCCQLLPHLDYGLIRGARKPVLAFSDGCVLVNAIASKSRLVAFYGPNVVGKLDATDYSDLRSLGQGGLRPGCNLLGSRTSFEPFTGGLASGILIGGNLSTFANAILGSCYDLDADEVILLWESGPKTAQDLDTILCALRLSKGLPRLKGMVIGQCEIKRDERWGEMSLSDIVGSVFDGVDIPILHAPVFGHSKLLNPIFPIGCRVELDSRKGALILQECPVSG
ncbi:MAG: LD-carboxypeptidase [Verrucomicrobia bacterium]|nr:LD-carboxypeptidase [Verrucomicrobiota bacterium]